jgi:AcrR family transcriptional regulator
MRAVARRLGVAPNALYSHIEGKPALVDAVLDDVIGEIPLPDPGLSARDGVAAIMRDIPISSRSRWPGRVPEEPTRGGWASASWSSSPRRGSRMLPVATACGSCWST